MADRITEAADDFDKGLSDDLNTAQALAAMYDFVREANIAMDKGEFQQSDVALAQEFLSNFDKVFAILEDNDAEKLQSLGYEARRRLSKRERDRKIVAESQSARQRRDFAESIVSVMNCQNVVYLLKIQRTGTFAGNANDAIPKAWSPSSGPSRAPQIPSGQPPPVSLQRRLSPHSRTAQSARLCQSDLLLLSRTPTPMHEPWRNHDHSY